MTTQPADLSATYSLYSKTENKILKRRLQWPTADGTPPPGMSADLVLLKELVEPAPEPNHLTERLERSESIDLEAKTATVIFEIVDLLPEEVSANIRAATRDAMATKWNSLPAYIKGPYRSLFIAANELLDAGDDVSASELVRHAEPTTLIRAFPDKMAVFTQAQNDFLAAVDALNDAD